MFYCLLQHKRNNREYIHVVPILTATHNTCTQCIIVMVSYDNIILYTVMSE